MTDVLKELQAYLDGDNSVVMSKRLVSETIAELASEREQGWKAHAANLSLEEDNDALLEKFAQAEKAWQCALQERNEMQAERDELLEELKDARNKIRDLEYTIIMGERG